MPLSLFVIKENPVVRHRLSTAVLKNPDMVIVGDGPWSEETLGRLQAEQPDILIFELFDESQVHTQIATIRKSCPKAKTKLLAVARAHSLTDTMAAIDCGVDGLLTSGFTVDEIRSTILKLGQNETYLDSAIALQILGRLDSSETRRKKAMALQLTDLEKDVIRDLSNGQSNLEISDRLSVSERTVKSCISGLKEKFGVKKRLDVVLSAKSLALDCIVAVKGLVVWLMTLCEESSVIPMLLQI